MSCVLLKLNAVWLTCQHLECTCLTLDSVTQHLSLVPGAVQGWMTTVPIRIPRGFQHAIPSWNIRVPSGSAYEVEIRVAGTDRGWTPWFSNHLKTSSAEARQSKVVWDIDQVRSAQTLEWLQFRVTLQRASGAERSPELSRLSVATRSNRNPTSLPQWKGTEIAPIQIPFIYQHEVDSELGSRICSPTSLSMVLQGMGIEVTLLEIAQQVYHTDHQLYGVWSQAVHVAYQYGVNSWVQFFEHWEKVARVLRKSIPIIVSIAFKEGDLAHPPYPSTDGHLLVLLGIDSEGNPITHDPHLPPDQGAFLKWDRADFTKAWFGHGGVAYVFTRDESPLSTYPP
jgi:hypothetical protein